MINVAMTLAAEDSRSWLERLWLKPAMSDFGAWSDGLFMFVMWVCIVSFVLLMVPMCYWAWRWRRRPGHVQIRTPNHNTLLEITWIVVPLGIVTVMFFWGFHGFIRAFATASNAEVINITGRRWKWDAVYANGATSQESVKLDSVNMGDGSKRSAPSDSSVFVVPAGRPVKFMLTSTDVIHSFYVPDARIKVDVFPNRYTSLTFTPLEDTKDQAGSLYFDEKDRAGSDHYVFCAEYCGQNHSEMAAIIRVVPENVYQSTIKEWADIEKLYENSDGSRDPRLAAGTAALPLWQYGQRVRESQGCNQCHTVDGTAGTGPSWKGSYGTAIAFADGTTLKPELYPGSKDMDDTWANYIRESIQNPSKHVHAGFQNQMAPYTLSEKAIQGVIAYFRHLNGAEPAATPKAPAN